MSRLLENLTGLSAFANPYGVCTISHMDLTILVLDRRTFKNAGRCCEAGGDPTAMIAPQIAACGESIERPTGSARVEPGDHKK
jgi:hypothetical protein